MNETGARVTAAFAALAVATSLALSGCSIAPSQGASGGGTGGGGQSGSGSTEGGSTESPGDINLGDLEGLPDTFPVSEIPLIDGDVKLGVDLGTGWSLIIPVDDFQASFADAVSKLKDAGFTSQVEQISEAGGVSVLENDKYQINLTAADSPDNGPSITYVVILKG